MNSEIERRCVRYRGRVQGVGFRHEAMVAARGLPVTGYVRNLSNGEVELVVEGPAKVLDMYLSSISRRMAPGITDTTVTSGLATGEFSGFDIRH